MEVNLVGDSAETLRALIPHLQRKTDRSWQQGIEKNVQEWWGLLEARAMDSADPVNPQRVFWELSPRVPDRCIIAADSGSSTNWYARDIKIRRGMMTSLSGNLATMGPAVPYAIAAKFAYPDRPVLAIAGDGTMQMNGVNGLITIAKFWREWKDPRLVVLVLNNNDLNQVTWEIRILAGNPKYYASQDVPEFSYARYADMLGLKGIVIAKPEDIVLAWEQAFASDRPVVVDAHTDPNVPPLPLHISLKEMKNFLSSLFKGEPEAVSVIKQSVKETVDSVLPHGSSHREKE
jgi:pyruvate dehydrogenase (quinone)